MSSNHLPGTDFAWSTLITNCKYLEGVLTLDYALQKVGSKYPLVVLYTPGFPLEGIAELKKRGIHRKRIEYLEPVEHRDYSSNPRFNDCWTKLQSFALYEFKRVVLLDSDMIVTQNMDELMEIPLDKSNRVFAASHACVCNPFQKECYPKDWIPENCPYSHYNNYTYEHSWEGPPCDSGLKMCNGGLLVIEPDLDNYNKIITALNSPKAMTYEFPDQSLLSDVFASKWVPLSYKYNALKTLKWIHSDIWNANEVKNIHYIINPKPWDDVPDSADNTDTFRVWRDANNERLQKEAKLLIV